MHVLHSGLLLLPPGSALRLQPPRPGMSDCLLRAPWPLIPRPFLPSVSHSGAASLLVRAELSFPGARHGGGSSCSSSDGRENGPPLAVDGRRAGDFAASVPGVAGLEGTGQVAVTLCLWASVSKAETVHLSACCSVFAYMNLFQDADFSQRGKAPAW